MVLNKFIAYNTLTNFLLREQTSWVCGRSLTLASMCFLFHIMGRLVPAHNKTDTPSDEKPRSPVKAETFPCSISERNGERSKHCIM